MKVIIKVLIIQLVFIVKAINSAEHFILPPKPLLLDNFISVCN